MKVNHITFSVSDLKRSIPFYRDILGATLLLEGEMTAYFDLSGVWLALNVQEDIPRNEIHNSYTHMAFTVREEELEDLETKLVDHHVNILQGRNRSNREGQSIYFTDPDGHKFEFHTGSLQQRLQYYRDEQAHKYTFYT